MKWFQNHKTAVIWVSVLLVFIAIMLTVIGLKGWTSNGVVFFFKNILINNFLGINAILLGFLTFLGYMILGRGFAYSFTGMLKTMIGVLFLSIGAGALIGMAKPIFQGLSTISKDTTTVPVDPYSGWVSSQNFLKSGITTASSYISWISFALIIGMIVNMVLVLLKKWTNVHSIMITGHVMFQQAAIVVPVVYLFLFRSLVGMVNTQDVSAGNQIGIILFSGLILGTYWGVASTSTIRGTQKVTNNAGFAVGHQQMFGAALAFKFGKYLGSPKDSVETKKISKKFKIFEDNIFTQALIILILFAILIIILKTSAPKGWDPLAADSPYKSWKVAGGAYWILNMVLGSLKLVASILVITAGVRMFVTELQQAFHGIASKLLPGSMVAVDCAATYGFSPNAVTYGFVSGLLGQFAAVGVIIGLVVGAKVNMVIVIPLFITLFFNSGTIGVFANAGGGWKANLIIPALFGFFEMLIVAGALYIIKDVHAQAQAADATVASQSNPFATGFNGMFDWNAIFGFQFIIAGQNIALGWIVLILFMILSLGFAQIIDTGIEDKQRPLVKFIRSKCRKQKVGE